MLHGKALALILIATAAQPAFARGPFDVVAIDDAALAGERGTANPSSLLTVNQLKRFQDDTARRDFGLSASVGGIIMDSWWADDGALLIGASRTFAR